MAMTDVQRRKAAKKFAADWKDRGYEKGDSQLFWIDLLTNVFGVEDIRSFIEFENQVLLNHVSFIDAYIPSTKVMIEQKSLGKDMKKPIRQSDGSLLTPFQQAKRYIAELPISLHPRWVVTCNFSSFYIYDMEQPSGEPEVILLEDLEKEYYRLMFLVDSDKDKLQKEMEVSIAAGEIVGLLYDGFAKQYVNPESESSMKSLNKLCVRLVFCLWGEDFGIFGKRGMFHDYMSQFEVKHMRKALIELFQVLDTEISKRDPYLEPDLAAFPYVNGGLFADENIEIPHFTEEIRDLLLVKASQNFDWSEISPTIFGAVFESTLNPETRRKGGMHYTSIENIHRVIDPLFLNDLTKELEEIEDITVIKTRKNKLDAFQDKLSKLTFLDPACGSGNFLTETFLSLRRLENRVIKDKTGGQMVFGDAINPIKVSISQFYGIEINDFAVTVAKTALWIAESQMMKETENIIHMQLDFLPLKTNAYVVEGNALHIDWNEVVNAYEVTYVIGNPPFVGHKNVNDEQKKDMIDIFEGKQGRLDYVSAWYKKAAIYIQNTRVQCAFVSTNTIVQGMHVELLWNQLVEKYNIKINFAHRTFKWTSEAKNKASVFCVIIGFATFDRNDKVIYFYGKLDDDGQPNKVPYISPYLDSNQSGIIGSISKPICSGVPKMVYGNIPRDGGFYTFTDAEKEEFIQLEPNAEKYIFKFLGSKEYINNTQRWILFLRDCPPSELRKMPLVMERVENVKNFRLSSKAKEIHKFAETPTLFAQQTQPIGKDFIIVPIVSSSRRRYIPIGYVDGSVLTNNRVFCIPEGDLYTFGILTSNVHNAWMRKVGVRLKDDYSYSKDLVYNTFPWCNPTPEQKARIEQTAQGILDARALYPDCSLADLYDELAMPPELRKAHQQNDIAVMKAYGFSIKDTTESSCVAELMRMYQDLVDKK